MVSMLPVVLVCSRTGATAAVCGSLRKTSATFTDAGAPLALIKTDEPGGRTKRSAPIAAVRCLLSFSIPNIRPTIMRISVTSTAMAKILISDRIGRCTRLETIILFIATLYWLRVGNRREAVGNTQYAIGNRQSTNWQWLKKLGFCV